MQEHDTIVRAAGSKAEIAPVHAGSTPHVKSELDGIWIAEDAAVAGVRAPQIIGHHLTFDGGRFCITMEGRLRFGGQFSLDPDAAPRTIDFDQSETENLAGIWRGIYNCAGDRLTICDNAYDLTRPRPAGFHQAGDQGYVKVNFRRCR